MSYKIYERVMADLAKNKDGSDGDSVKGLDEKVEVKIVKKRGD